MKISEFTDNSHIDELDAANVGNAAGKDDMNFDQLLAQDIAASMNPEVPSGTIQIEDDNKSIQDDEDMD